MTYVVKVRNGWVEYGHRDEAHHLFASAVQRDLRASLFGPERADGSRPCIGVYNPSLWGPSCHDDEE